MLQIRLLTFFFLAVAAIFASSISIGACSSEEQAPKQHQRTLPEARQIALELFGELDQFKLVKQREVGLAGRPAVRMEADWNHEGQKRRGIIYLIDHPSLFNVIHYTAPSEMEMFDAGYPVFQQMLKDLKVAQHAGQLTVEEVEGHKIMRSPDLQLKIRYPADWVYSLDEVNRALVFSGPKDKPSWLTTVSFSVISKWEKKEDR